jgi:hypothetical protein
MITTLAFFFFKKNLKINIGQPEVGKKKMVTIARFPYLCDFQYIAKNIGGR